MYYQSLSEEKPVYKPALERWNRYKSIWIKHWPEFEKIYPHRFEKLYGQLDEEKVDEVKKFLQCGEFKNGFQRHICPDCGLALIVPFTKVGYNTL